jgi:hypothetical protein
MKGRDQMDGPHLIHGKQRITTDQTLRDDLTASLAATYRGEPLSTAHIHARLMAIDASLDAIIESIGRLLEMTQRLATNTRDHVDD